MPPFGKRWRKVRQEYHARRRAVKIVDAAEPLCYTPGVPTLGAMCTNTRLVLILSRDGIPRVARAKVSACSSVGEHHPDTVGVVGSIPTTHTISAAKTGAATPKTSPRPDIPLRFSTAARRMRPLCITCAPPWPSLRCRTICEVCATLRAFACGADRGTRSGAAGAANIMRIIRRAHNESSQGCEKSPTKTVGFGGPL